MNIGLLGQESASATQDVVMPLGSNRMAPDPRLQRVAAGGADGEEMADVDVEEEAGEGASDMTTAETESVARTATDIETETETGALATND